MGTFKKSIFLLALVAIALLAGCSYEKETIIYQGKERPVSQVEEIVADQLEAENPELDLEVEITEEVKD